MFDKELTKLNDYQEFADFVCMGYTRDVLWEKESDDEWKVNQKALGHELAYNVIGLNEEAGEVAGKLKKAVRRKDLDSFCEEFETDPEARKKFLLELGDCLYYLSRCAGLVGSDLQEVANLNRLKLKDRHARGVVKGEGDDR